MFNINRVTLLGTVVRDADRKATSTGIAFTEFRLATETGIKTVQGRKESIVEFHHIVCFDDLSEFAAKLKKGKPLYVEGRIHTKRFRNNDGDDRSVLEVIADKLVILSKKSESDAT